MTRTEWRRTAEGEEDRNGELQEEDRREVEWLTHYGDERERTGTGEDTTVRLATMNINSYPNAGTTKAMRLIEETRHFDCLGLSELNKNWYKLSAQESIYNRTSRRWPHQKHQMSWLRDAEWPSEFQKGGVSLTLASNTLAKYGTDKGEDMAGLGRWAWQVIEGHADTRTVIIQVYRPNRNQKDNGSTYVQQQVVSGERDPIKTFDCDLLAMLDSFIDTQHQVVIMGDFNVPLDGKSQIEKAFKERGIFDMIQTRYPGEAPATHKRGSAPIDAIFASETLGVIKGGYEGGMDELSDHRLLWVDLTLDSLLGIDRGDIVKPKAKKLQAKNRIRVTRFNKILLQQIRQHQLLLKARELEADIGHSKVMTVGQKGKYEGIDTQRCRAVAHAEKECVKLPPNELEFSDKLQHAIGTATLWNLIKKKAQRKKKINKRWLIDTKKRLGVQTHIDVPSTWEGIVTATAQARKALTIAQKQAPELRSEFLDALIQQAEDAGNLSKARDLKQIKEAEKTKGVHKRIKMARGKLRGGGVRFIHEPTEDGGVRTVKDKLLMEKAILEANAAKLHSANESPIRQGELGLKITDHDYEQWERLLHETVELPAHTDEGTRKWIKYFRGTPLADIDIPFSTDDYVRSWRAIKEHTSCAPGAMHFGTFKTMHLCRPAAELHTIMARLPMQTGYVPERWTESVDSMLPKKENEWRPSKLRLTSLLMPDFNHNNKILGKAAMQQAEKAGALAPEQYGSRKQHSASKHALNKRLMMDALRIQRRPGVLIANDAKSCYDRILHVAAYLALRRAGLKKEAVRSMLEPIRRLKHNIRTAYGDSEVTYGGEDWTRDPSGICQGNGAGPAIWALVSSPLLDILRNEGHGAKLHAAIGDTFLNLAGFAFVDDTDIIQTGDLGDTTPDMVAQAQAELDTWEALVRATGGGIAGDKSDYAIVNFKWDKGKWKYADYDECHHLTVRDGQGQRETLTQLHTWEARRTLGIWQAVDGNERKQAETMKDKATEWSRAAARSSLTRSDVTVGIKTSLYPSLTYGLMATTLTEAQCQDIFKPVRKGALPKAGYCRNIPTAVIHGPSKYGGLDIKDLYTIQGTEHIKVLLDDGGTTSPTGQLLDITSTGHLLEIGRSGRLLDMRYADVQHLMTESWVKDTLDFISKHNITITSTGPILRTWRQGDYLLMDALHQQSETVLTEEDTQAFNRCRVYLQVTTWSDICTAPGTHVLHDAWECKHTWTSASQMAYDWPFQPRPSKRDITIWKRLLQLVFQVSPRHLQTAQRLGAYFHNTRRVTKWMFSVNEDSLYQRHERGWRRWRRVRQRTRTTYFEQTDDVNHQFQRQWDMAVVSKDASMRVRLEGHETFGASTVGITQDGDTTVAQPACRESTLESKIAALPYSMKWVMEDITLPEDEGREIAAQIIQDKARCISDGSLKDTYGTSAALSMDTSDNNGYTICNRTPGGDEDQSSFRSELCGILANVVMMNQIAILHGVEEGTVDLACDNESALWVSFGTTSVHTSDSSFDLIRVIKHELQRSPLTWTFRHVKGHQDEDGAQSLDEWALANIAADNLAEQYWTKRYVGRPRERPSPPRMPGEGWRLSLCGNTVSSNVGRHIHEHSYAGRMAQYWERKKRVRQGMHNNVSWLHHLGALRLLPRAQQQWVLKHHCGFEGNNSMLHLWGQRVNPWCPMCKEVETHRHILRCQSSITTSKYETEERHLGSWLKATTSYEILRAILTHLRAYRDDEVAETADHWDEEVQTVSQAQTLIGPNAFAEGFLVPGWGALQHQYVQDTESKQDPDRWVKELIKRMWLICRAIWDTRNDRVHRHAETRKATLTAQLDENITTAHEVGSANAFLPHMERRFFRQPIEQVLQQTDYQKRTWLHIANRFITRDRQRVAQNRSTQIMREFLKPGSTADIVRNRRRILNRQVDDFQVRPGHGGAPSGRQA